MSSTLRVLIAYLSGPSARRLVLALAQGGFVPSYVRVDTADSLGERLASYDWDLVLAGDGDPALPVGELIDTIRGTRPDVPMVVVRERGDAGGPAVSDDPLVIDPAGGLDEKGLLAAVRRVLSRVGVRLPGVAVDSDLLLHRAYFEQLFENSPQAIAIVNNDFLVVEVNRGFETLYGYTPDEAKGAILSDLIVPADMRSESESLRRAASDTGLVQRETVRMGKDGSKVHVIVVACTISAGGVAVGMFWIYTDITARKTAEEAMRLAERQYRGVVNNAVMGIFQATLDLRLTMVNPALAAILGCSSTQELLDRPELCEMFLNDPERGAELWSVLGQSGEVSGFEVRTRRPDGQPIWLALSARVVQGAAQGQRFLEGAVENVTARKLAEQKLSRAEAKYRSIFEHCPDGIYQVDPEGRYISANPALARILGYEGPAEIMDCVSLDVPHYVNPANRLNFLETLRESGAVMDFEAEVRRRDGQVIWISESAWEVRGSDGRLQYHEGLVQDVSARKSAEDQLRHQAFHDALTGLPNRILFMDRLGWALSRSKRKHGYRFAVFFLDLDRFKVVNDSLGHMAGDALLVEVANRLRRALRPMDTVARFGGDEFAVLVDDISGTLDATHVLARLHEELAKPMVVQGRQVFTSASVGVVLKTWTYEKAEHLVRDADIAMYRAKALGKDRYEIFDPSMHQAATSLLQLETDLRQAMDRGEMRLHYQPIVDILSGELRGFEALVRWQHPARGLIPPSDFIPVAEETGIIMSLGMWVLEGACAQLARWHRLQPAGARLSMSVNLSAKQFMNLELVAQVRHILDKTGIPPETLRLEITESKVMENAEFASRMLSHLKDLGVKISIDDFGTGYSSLAYLHRFPLDTLKIDRSFVGKMGEGHENSEIVGAIVGLARNLGLEVVAEGVEQEGQLEELRGLSCQLGQGFLFSRPLPMEEAEVLVVNGIASS